MVTETPEWLPVIGLLGGVASGKSAVAARLVELGAAALDADREVGELLESPEIVARIGREVSAGAVKDGEIDRAALGAVVFGDEKKRKALEGILHPPVVDAARRLVAGPPEGADAVVIDAPLLIEAGLDVLCDELWFVETPVERRLAWARERRGWGEGELEQRERAQVSLEEKRRLVDRVIENDGSLDDLNRAVDRAWAELFGAPA